MPVAAHVLAAGRTGHHVGQQCIGVRLWAANSRLHGSGLGIPLGLTKGHLHRRVCGDVPPMVKVASHAWHELYA